MPHDDTIVHELESKIKRKRMLAARLGDQWLKQVAYNEVASMEKELRSIQGGRNEQ